MVPTDDKLIHNLQSVIRRCVKVMAVLMTFVICMGVIDIAWFIYQKLVTAPILILTMTDMLATFGAFMAALIAIEIFVNITIYLRDEVIHVKIVVATALMAVSRKVIILDLKTVTDMQILGLAALVIALSVGYWLVRQLPSFQLFPRPTEPEQPPVTEKPTE